MRWDFNLRGVEFRFWNNNSTILQVRNSYKYPTMHTYIYGNACCHYDYYDVGYIYMYPAYDYVHVQCMSIDLGLAMILKRCDAQKHRWESQRVAYTHCWLTTLAMLYNAGNHVTQTMALWPDTAYLLVVIELTNITDKHKPLNRCWSKWCSTLSWFILSALIFVFCPSHVRSRPAQK